MTDQIGTLAELGVKPGDVVELVSKGNDGWSYPNVGEKHTIAQYGCWFGVGREYLHELTGKFRLISRATPSVDLTKLTAPFGLLDEVYGPGTAEALKAHGGPYERYGIGGWCKTKPAWVADTVYHVIPAPKRETVTQDMTLSASGAVVFGGTPNCTVTYDTLDGVIGMATYRVVPK